MGPGSMYPLLRPKSARVRFWSVWELVTYHGSEFPQTDPARRDFSRPSTSTLVVNITKETTIDGGGTSTTWGGSSQKPLSWSQNVYSVRKHVTTVILHSFFPWRQVPHRIRLLTWGSDDPKAGTPHHFQSTDDGRRESWRKKSRDSNSRKERKQRIGPWKKE